MGGYGQDAGKQQDQTFSSLVHMLGIAALVL
jgi:hypothetical protein